MYTILENKNETIDLVDNQRIVGSFVPNFDLYLALELLKKFNQIEDREGRKIHAIWNYKGYYVYPAIQERIYWGFFLQIVKHQKAWSAIRGKSVRFETHPYWCQRGLHTAYQFLHHNPGFLQRTVYNLVGKFLRRQTQTLPEVFVYDDGDQGFRYAKIKEAIGQLTPFTRIEKLKANNASSLFKKNVFASGKKCYFRSSPPVFDFEKYEFLHPYLDAQEFRLLIDSMHRQCTDFIAECEEMDHLFSKNPPKAILGYDQCEEIIGLIAAAKIHHIPTYMFQHGLFTPFHAGWLCPGIPREYCNLRPDTLSVWGPYWKKMLVSLSNRYTDKDIVIGAHHNRVISYEIKGRGQPSEKKDRLTVLFPYEFLTDNVAISQYMRHFLKMGWKVIVKIRPEPGSRDDLSYDRDLGQSILFVENLSDQDLDQIDVVACTQTTFAYDMMQYLKPIWYLDTKFTFLKQMVDDGIAYFIDEDKMESFNDPKILSQYLKPRYSIDTFKTIYSDRLLYASIKEILQTLRLPSEQYGSH